MKELAEILQKIIAEKTQEAKNNKYQYSVDWHDGYLRACNVILKMIEELKNENRAT